MTRLILDANILLAALAGRSSAPPSLLLAGVHNGEIESVACPLLIEEIRENLGKPYFRARLSELEAQEALDAYVELCVMLPDPENIEPLLRDPEDDYLVALARTAKATAIVTGDKDLLDHPDLEPPAIDASAACELTRLTRPS